uniref:ATP synthase complex subunit 8 n=1 Tax=Atherina boyeri TaxID=87785 RepID=A0A8E8U2L5_ATHBO|nr:ATP synthase F0 subunit 8 [Atherina boyeri]
MPQLNPAPWFLTLAFAWVIFIAFVFPKILSYTYPHKPASQNTQKSKTASWTWPWQ